MVTGLLALDGAAADLARALGRERGGRFRLDPLAPTDPAAATATLGGSVPDAAVVDVQTHFLENLDQFGAGFPQASCRADDPADCFSADVWYDLVLTQSETRLAVISAVPVVGEADPLSIDAMERGRQLATGLCGEGRVLIQGHAVPDVGPIDAAVAAMLETAAAHSMCAWKAYTHSPSGWFLDDHDPAAPAIGRRFLDGVRQTGVPVVAVHKGLSGGNPYASPVDIGPAAAANPDLSFLVYHSGYEAGVTEGPYDPDGAGVDRLVRSVSDAGVAPAGNVYAELGSTWRTVMGRPDEAAHVLGKLLVAFGPERVLWGTDSIWYGSPQDQIDAFRTFEITPAFQEQFGYPALTADIKTRILGANAAELFGVEIPAATCSAAAEGWRSADGTLGPVARRDVLAVFRREHPWIAAAARR
jgi:predicted TIM-barrel fold metal-dependent hydrolase